MKAAVILTPGDLVVMDIPEPALGDYDAKCDVLFGAICTGTDQHIVADEFPWPVTFPCVLGHESIGRVTQIGPKVRHLKVGDLVTRVGIGPADDGSYGSMWGGFVQHAIARDFKAMQADGIDPSQWQEHRRNLVLPADFDPAAATMIITWRETFSFISRMKVSKNSSVLVIGSGGNGLAFIAHAKNLGAKTIAMVGAPARRDATLKAGATHCYDYNDTQLADAIKADTPDGFDFAIDAVGKAGQLDVALPHLRAGGTLAQYGIDDYGKCTLNPHFAPGSFQFYKGGYDESEVHDQVVQFVKQGKLDASHWLDLENPYPLENINDAFDALRQRKNVKGLIRILG